MDLVPANVESLQLKLRKIAETPGFSPRKSKSPSALDPRQRLIIEAAASLDTHLQRILATTNFIEAPIKATLNQTLQVAKKLGDDQMAQKASQKFQRIFGSMLSAIDVIRSNLAPIVHETTAVREGNKVLDVRGAKQLIETLSAALPIIRSGFKSIEPKNHESAVESEIRKQAQFLVQIKKVLASSGVENPEAQARLKVAAEGAEFYLENLRRLSDPEFADRIQTNVDRSLTQNIPAAIHAAKALAKVFGAVERAASSRKFQKRLQTVAKRIVLLAYLRSKSSLTRI